MCAPNPRCGGKGENNFCMQTDGNYTNLGIFQFVRYVDQTFTIVYNKGDQVGFPNLTIIYLFANHALYD